MKKIMLVFGTRPEAIKMCPLVNELKTRKSIQTVVCVTGQHRQMLDQVLSAFKVRPDYDLSVMKDRQTLFDVTENILKGIQGVLEEVKPDAVLVHGDTSTTFASALACFYLKIPIGHVEAGLRTYQMYSPYPEEFNRQAVGCIASFHFAPTDLSKQNLLKEGKKSSTVYVTGNTAIDALKTTVREDYAHEQLDDRIRMIEPLEVLDFHNFLARSYLILTDSGGIQEEAPSLGKPVLVMRDTTDRPEGVKAGTLKLVGTKEETIYNSFKELLENPIAYQKMSQSKNPYGDGFTCRRIADILEQEL